MKFLTDLKGRSFGRLYVIQYDGLRFTPSGITLHYWECRCECGARVKVIHGNLLRGHTRSCGCLSAEMTGRRRRTHGHSCLGHRGKGSKVYLTWMDMIQRCKSKGKNRRWSAGVSVCKRWQTSFELFLEDMGEPPSPKHSIDRIDNKGNYEPKNCRWATSSEQARNTSRNNFITFQGRTMCLADWAKELGMEAAAVRYRIRKWGLKRALTTKRLWGKSRYECDS